LNPIAAAPDDYDQHMLALPAQRKLSKPVALHQISITLHRAMHCDRHHFITMFHDVRDRVMTSVFRTVMRTNGTEDVDPECRKFRKNNNTEKTRLK